MKLLALLTTVLIFVSLISLYQTIEFCNAFKQNNYMISYGFRRIIRHQKVDVFRAYIFIGNSYWELVYNDGDPNYRNIAFVSNKSEESDWFGNQYSMAFCIFTPPSEKQNDCTTYLLDFKNKEWHYGYLNSSLNTPLKLSGNFQKTIVTNVGQVTDRIGFVPNHSQLEGRIILFKQEPKPEYVNYQMEESDPNPIAKEIGKVKVEHNALKEMPINLPIVAIFGRYSLYDYKQIYLGYIPDSAEDLFRRSRKEGHGVIVLFKNESSLLYCYTFAETFDNMCLTKNLKLLIDCGFEPKHKTTTSLQTSLPTSLRTTKASRSDYTLLIVLGVIAIIILVIIIICILIVCLKQNDKKEKAFKGLKPPTKPLFPTKNIQKAESSTGLQTTPKSEAFSVKSNIDYSKPIPMQSTVSAVNTSESTLRPTDLKVKPK